MVITARGERKEPAAGRVRRGWAPIVAVLACMLLPYDSVAAQDAHAPAPRHAAAAEPAEAGHAPAPTDASQAPGEGHAPNDHASGGSRPEHAEDAHEAAHGEGDEESGGVSIHAATWISGLLKKLWYSGPATISASGAVDASGHPIDGASLAGVKVEAEWEDHHAHASPKPKYHIRGTLGSVGSSRPAGGAHLLHATTADGREILLAGAQPVFQYEQFFPLQIVISTLTALGILLAAVLMCGAPQLRPGKAQALVEILYEAFDGFVKGIIGEHYKKYVPLIATAFIYIFCMNVAGLIPGWASPTSNINVTAGMAVVVIAFVHYEGLRVNGIVGYLKHYVGEPLWLAPLNIPIHIIGEIAKLMSLTIRLFGNIFGEDVVIVILVLLAGLFSPAIGPLQGYLPFPFVMYLMGVFTSLVQALVFAILSSVYIAMWTTHEDHGSHEHVEHGRDHGPAHAHAAA